MEQIGYSLVDGQGSELQFWGDTLGQCQGLPDVIVLPNGDRVHGAKAGEALGGNCRLVKRMGELATENSVSFDGADIIVRKRQTVPDIVTNYQARAALIAAGMFDTVNGAMLALPANSVERQAWEYANTFSRQSPIIAALGAQLNLTNQQIDDLFTAAAQVA